MGEGTFGAVFEARAPGAPPLAIKFFKETRDVEPEVKRFMACAGVSQIVRLLDVEVFVKTDKRPSIGFAREARKMDKFSRRWHDTNATIEELPNNRALTVLPKAIAMTARMERSVNGTCRKLLT